MMNLKTDIGEYLLKLIPCRKSNWSHVGSSPTSPTFIIFALWSHCSAEKGDKRDARPAPRQKKVRGRIWLRLWRAMAKTSPTSLLAM